MVGGQRPPAFRNQVRMREIVFIGSVDESIDTVVHIFLNGVVHRTFAIAGACTVVVYSQSATAIHELHIITQMMELDVKLRSFAQGGLYAAYLGNLAADVEMDKFQAVFHTFGFQHVECFQQFTGRQTELAGISAAFFPFPAARRSQFDTDTDIGSYVEFLGNLVDGVQLVEFLYHQEDAFAHLLGQ